MYMMYIQLIIWEYTGQALWRCKRCQISNYILLLIQFPSIGNFAIQKAKLLQFCKLQFIKMAKLKFPSKTKDNLAIY
jgi:hypothetical protein